jgi:tetratricopeptide (TPR) repeat protein
MKRGTILIILITLLFGLAVLLANLPLSPAQSAPVLLAVTPAADQTEFLRRLELGRQYEQRNLLSQAQGEYQQAALAGDDVIALAGRENEKRLAEFQQTPIYQIHSKLAWLKDPVLWMVFLLLILLLVILFYPQRAAYQVVLFNDSSKDQAGNAIHRIVHRRLLEITQAYRKAQKDLLIDLERFEFLTASDQPDPYADLLAVLSTIKLGPVPVPLDKLRLFLDKWRVRNETQLSGDFYLCGDTCYLDARLTRRDQVLENWPLQASGQKISDAIDVLSSELTYRFLEFILKGKTGFQSWGQLKAWCEGLSALQQAPTGSDCLQAALQALEAAQVQEPQNREIAFLIGTIYFKLEQYEQAREAYYRVMQGEGTKGDDLSLASSLRLAESIFLEFDPRNFEEARRRFAEIHSSLRETTMDQRQKQVAALACCGQARIWAHWLYEDPDDKNSLDHVLEYCQRALSLAGDTKDVQAACSIALGFTNYNRGLKKDASPDLHKNALRDFDDAVRASRNYPSALIYLARMLAWMSVAKRNPAALDKKILNEKDPEQKNVLQRTLEEHTTQAIALLEESISKGLPGRRYAEQQMKEVLFRLGRFHAKTGQLDKGLDEYRRLVEMDPQMADAWDNLAYRPIDAGRTDLITLSKCEVAARKAVALGTGSPQEATYLATLADVLYHLGRYQEAMQEIERAYALPVKDEDIRLRIAKIRQKVQEKLAPS